MSLTSGTPAGYSLFKRCAPVFLRSVARFPELWSKNSSILISEVLRGKTYEIRKFAFHDSIIALALGVPPLIHYDTATSWVDEGPKPYLEWVCGVPAGIIAQIAKINSWRTLRLMGQATSNEPDWREIEAHVQRWSPSVEHTEEPNGVIMRLAIQESWHQGVLIYLYMVRQTLVSQLHSLNILNPQVWMPSQFS